MFTKEQYQIVERTDFEKDLKELSKPKNRNILEYALYIFFGHPIEYLKEYTLNRLLKELKKELKEHKRVILNKIKITNLTDEDIKRILYIILKQSSASGKLSTKSYISIALEISLSPKEDNLLVLNEFLKSYPTYATYIPKKSVKKSLNKSTKKLTKKSVKKSTKKSTQKSTKKSTKKRVGRPVKKSTKKSKKVSKK